MLLLSHVVVSQPCLCACRDLLSCQVRQGRASCLTQETLCTTLAGNNCPVVTITAPEDEGSPLHERKGALFTGGVQRRSCFVQPRPWISAASRHLPAPGDLCCQACWTLQAPKRAGCPSCTPAPCWA